MDLVAALALACERRDRADAGWPGAERARAALAVLAEDREAFAPGTARVDELGRTFDLAPLDVRVLDVALAAETHPAAHLLCGLLTGDEAPARPTVALALELVGASVADAAARERFAPGAPMLRAGLVGLTGDDVLLARRVRLPDRVAAHLLGSDVAPPSVLAALREPPPLDVAGVDAVAAALAAGDPLVWVVGGSTSAGASLAAGACRALDVPCLVGDLSRVADDAVEATVRDLVLEAGLTGAVLVVLAAERAPGLVDAVDRAAFGVVAVSRTPWDARWSDSLPVEVVAPRLTGPERAELWDAVVGPGVAVRDVVALRMTPEQIRTVGARALLDADAAGVAPGPEHVRAAARRLTAPAHRSTGTTTTATLADLVLPPVARREVERLVAWASDRDDVLALGALQGKGGKGAGIAALFSGSPGTGKTLAAHVLADSLGTDLVQVDLSTVVDKYIGETEKNLERVFAQAESLNAVLLFDEADALFGSRSAVTDARDRYANQEVAYLLQRMESFDGITVLATNLRGNLDPAFARRLHFMIHFPDPDAPTRRLLWEHHLAQLPATDPDDPVDVATLGEALVLSGGDIRNVVLAAAYDAVAERTTLGMRHVRGAALRETAKLGRRVPADALDGARAATPR